MKKCLIALLCTLSITFAARAALLVAFPIPVFVTSALMCTFGSMGPVDCTAALTLSGPLIVTRSVLGTASYSGFFDRVRDFALGLVLLDEQGARVELQAMDLNNLSPSITKEQAISFNEHKEEIGLILTDVSGIVSQRESVTGREIARIFEDLYKESELPEQARLALINHIKAQQ